MDPSVFAWPVRVYWEDTDAGGVVYYANYLKFFERGRTEWLRHLGVEQHLLAAQTGGMFVVGQANVRYLRPARLDDELRVTTQVTEWGRASIGVEQAVWRLGTAEPTLLCQGHVRAGWVDMGTLKPGRIPAMLLQRLKGHP